MTKINFIDNARITFSVGEGNFINITPDQLSDKIRDMIAKQIYPEMDLILKIFISASSSSDDAVLINTYTWDGGVCQRILCQHFSDGRMTEVSKELM